MVPLSRYIVFLAVAGGGCAVDLVTKHWMFDRLGLPPGGRTWWLWDGVFGFQTSLNEGALFGMGQGLWPVFAAFSIAAAALIIGWLFVAGAARDRWLTISLSLVTAGIFGNLYDRLGLPGLVWPAGLPGHKAGDTVHAVRDFILMAAGNWQWPNYNIADSMLVCGAILLFCHALFVGEKHQKQEATDQKP